MFCFGKKQKSLLPKSSKYYKEIADKLTKDEISMLEKIFMDLSSRRTDKHLSLESFMLFFNLNGFWGQKLFQQFDIANKQLLTFELFLLGIATMAKNSEQERVFLLYNHFRNEQKGLSYGNFIKMLYNYPKEHLKHILNDQEFFTNEILQNAPHDHHRPHHDKVIEVDYSREDMRCASDHKESYFKQTFKNLLKHKDEGTSLYFDLENKKFCIRQVNINKLVRVFASRIYEKFCLDRTTGSLSFEQFSEWIKDHPKLYQSYYRGFHNYVWEHSKGRPLFKQEKSEKKTSNVRYYKPDTKQKVVTLMMVHTTLVILESSDDDMPMEVICLEGLNVLPVDNSIGAGIQITHKNGFYPEKTFYFATKLLQEEWADALKMFKGVSVQKYYSILDRLGTGNFSIVYRTIEKATGIEYAMKIIQTKNLQQHARESIIHQRRFMSILNNPAIVKFKESFETKTHLYIVTQLVKGVDLFQYVIEKDALNQHDAALIAGQIIEAMIYVHGLGIAHRDLKPENIMVVSDQKEIEDNPQIKIIDFGLSNYIEILAKSKQENIMGTPNYAAPQTLQREVITEKVDNFAIGVIIFFMLSGQLPFSSSNMKVVMENTVNCKYSFNGFRWQLVSKDAKDLVSHFLVANPADRIGLNEALDHPWFAKRHQKEKTLNRRNSSGLVLF